MVYLGADILGIAVEASVSEGLETSGCHQEAHCHGDVDVFPDGQREQRNCWACTSGRLLFRLAAFVPSQRCLELDLADTNMLCAPATISLLACIDIDSPRDARFWQNLLTLTSGHLRPLYSQSATKPPTRDTPEAACSANAVLLWMGVAEESQVLAD